MKINPEIFKAYDIRGIYGEDFNEDMAYKLGQGYIGLRKKDGLNKKLTIVVAMDMRLSSPQLKESLIKGLTEGGADVVDIGLASTPTFYFAVANFGYDGGIIVSASHNPATYNGFKITREKAVPVSGETGMYDLRDLVLENNFEKAEAPGEIIEKNDVLETQIDIALKHADLDKIKPLKIVIDPANSMGAQYLEPLFAKLPCEVIKINWELDGTFPAHEADPFKEENMQELQQRVLEEKADLGISTDGDGDRMFFVDNLGKTIDQAITRGILSKLFLQEKPGSKICYDIRPGRITRDMIKAAGGIPVVTRVGHSLIKEQTIKEDAYFAGESSGHFFLNSNIGCFEIPLMVTLKLLQEFSQIETSVAEYIKPYQKYFHSGEINTRVKSVKDKIAEITEKYSDGEQVDIDGITVEYPNYWFNVRGSNTEPLIRLNLEAVDQKTMEEKRDEVLNIIKN